MYLYGKNKLWVVHGWKDQRKTLARGVWVRIRDTWLCGKVVTFLQCIIVGALSRVSTAEIMSFLRNSRRLNDNVEHCIILGIHLSKQCVCVCLCVCIYV